MDELGHILREARETRGLTLAEVQEKIRINSKFLEALEAGNYQVLPTPVHVRGFLKNYSRFLGLDPQPLLDRYDRLQSNGFYRSSPQTNGELPPAVPAVLRQDQPFFNPVNMEVTDSKRRDPESAARLIVIVGLLVFLVLAGNRFLPLLTGQGDGSVVITEGLNEAVQSILNPAEETAESNVPTTIGLPTDVITSTSRNVEDGPATPFPTRPPLPATMEEVQLRLEITERTWMEVTIDGDVVFSGWAKKGDPAYEWTAQEEAKVNTGNANGIAVTINGVTLGRLGGFQEAKEEVWRTTN